MHYTVHKWSCGHCHDGRGKHENAKDGEQGVWIGPFDQLEFADGYLNRLEIAPNKRSYCQHCLN